jgi:acyl-CoA synthetase (AMP-forming)/AMP-acid ligase II
MGGLISPMPMQWRASELEFIAGITEAKAILTVESFGNFSHGEMAEKVKAKQATIREIIYLPEIREMTKGPVTGKLNDIVIDANDVFTLSWSSGTEAEPKGCPLSHNNWICQANLLLRNGPHLLGRQPDHAGPLVNMASIGTVYIPWLIGGGKLVLHHPFDGPSFVMQLMAEEISTTPCWCRRW